MIIVVICHNMIFNWEIITILTVIVRMIAIILKTKKPLNGFFFYSEYLVTFLREYLAINSDPKIITTHVIVQMMNNNPYEVASMTIPPTNGPIALPIAAQALVNP